MKCKPRGMRINAEFLARYGIYSNKFFGGSNNIVAVTLLTLPKANDKKFHESCDAVNVHFMKNMICDYHYVLIKFWIHLFVNNDYSMVMYGERTFIFRLLQNCAVRFDSVSVSVLKVCCWPQSCSKSIPFPMLKIQNFIIDHPCLQNVSYSEKRIPQLMSVVLWFPYVNHRT